MTDLRVLAKRFEWEEQGAVAYADYRREQDRLFIDYVYSPEQLRGTGAAGRLMTAVARYARSEGLRVVPICGYAATWLKRSEEFRDLLAG
jgi:predicted GNAT family acetyltransferase